LATPHIYVKLYAFSVVCQAVAERSGSRREERLRSESGSEMGVLPHTVTMV